MTTQPVKKEESMEEKNTRTHSIFEDPAIAEAAKDDPVVRFISRNWKTVIGALMAVALSMVAYNSFKNTAEQKRATATQTLMDIQQGYKAITEKQQELTTLTKDHSSETDPKKKEQVQQKIDAATKELNQLRDRTTLVVDSLKSPRPFDMLAQLYRGLIAARFGDYAITQGVLSSTSWEAVGASDSAERMVAEFAVLGLARSLVDAPNSREPVMGALGNLASKGTFAAVQAAVTLATIASTPEEKVKAREVVGEVSRRFPAQEKFLAPAREQVAL
jgi:hypothetical protein